MFDLTETSRLIDEIVKRHGESRSLDDLCFAGWRTADGLVEGLGSLMVSVAPDGSKLVLDGDNMELPIATDGSSPCIDDEYRERMAGIVRALKAKLDGATENGAV